MDYRSKEMDLRSLHSQYIINEKFTGKHLCQTLPFNKVEDLTPATILKRDLALVFSCEFCENNFFT